MATEAASGGGATESDEAVATTIMIVGKSGSGKSVLGNKLLNTNVDPGPFERYFEEGGGAAGIGTDCVSKTSKNGMIRVIDTPGIPDPCSRNTLKYFDAIVHKIRSLGVMNLLIFMVKEDRTDEMQFDHYRTLLEQFNDIPCEKLMVCRQPDYPYDPTEEAKMKKREDGIAFINDILTRSGMSMPHMFIMDGRSQEAYEALNPLHGLVQTCSRSSLTDSTSPKTYKELKEFNKKLTSRKSRMIALKEQLQTFAMSVKFHQRWKMVHTCVGLAGGAASIETLGVGGAVAAVAGGMIFITMRQIANIQQKEKMTKEEIENNHVDEVSLRVAKTRLDALERLAGGATESDEAVATTIMIVGKSGSGKSVLGNKLLNTNVDPDLFERYFEEGGGAAGIGTDCVSKTSENGMIRVIDTPGIPDPCSQNTLKHFNAIVHKIRSLGVMNLLIFMVKEDKTDVTQFDHYRTLLNQFNDIPCEKLMVCRQPDYPYPPTEKAKKETREDGIAFINENLNRSGMSMPYMFVMDGTSQEAYEALNRLHAFVQTCPRSSLTDKLLSMRL